MLTVHTSAPGMLWDAIQKAFENGEIDTWERDSDGDFTHTPTQWHRHAWMRMKHIKPDLALIFGILGRKDFKLTPTEYAVYHGRFAEMLDTHFRHRFSSLEISAWRTPQDSFTD